MAKLVVNIDKVATLRNSRGGNVPDILKAATDCQNFGADAIAVHPRPDGLHIKYEDVLALRNVVYTEFHVEGYPSKEFMDLMQKVKPNQVTIVPDAMVSSAGWDIEKNEAFLKETIEELQDVGARVAIFIDANPQQVEAVAKVGADRVQLFTEPYAEAFAQNPEAAVAPFVEAAKAARDCGLGVNAGHGLNLFSLPYLHQHISWLKEVSVGHALISDSLYGGLEKTIALYKDCMNV